MFCPISYYSPKCLLFGANRIPTQSGHQGVRRYEEVELKGKRLPEKGKAGAEVGSEADDDCSGSGAPRAFLADRVPLRRARALQGNIPSSSTANFA
jgi:hypothetical protein